MTGNKDIKITLLRNLAEPVILTALFKAVVFTEIKTLQEDHENIETVGSDAKQFLVASPKDMISRRAVKRAIFQFRIQFGSGPMNFPVALWLGSRLHELYFPSQTSLRARLILR